MQKSSSTHNNYLLLICLPLLVPAATYAREPRESAPCNMSRLSACEAENRAAIAPLQALWQQTNNTKNNAMEKNAERTKEMQNLRTIDEGHDNSEIRLKEELIWCQQQERTDQENIPTPLMAIKNALRKKNLGKEKEMIGFISPLSQQKILIPAHANAYKARLHEAVMQISEFRAPLAQAIAKKAEEIHSLTQLILATQAELTRIENALSRHAYMCNGGCASQICPI